MIIINNNQVYSDSDKFIHRIGSEVCFKRGTILVNDTEDNFEEVDELPKFTTFEYEEKVRELIKQKYSIDEELAIQRKAMVAMLTPMTLSGDNAKKNMNEFNEYNLFVENCKIQAKEILSNGEES